MNNIAGKHWDAVKSFAALLACVVVAVGCASGSKTVADTSKRKEAATFNLQLATDYYRQGNLSEAKEKTDRALGQDDHNAQAHMVAGLLYERLGNHKVAEQHFSKAVDLDPKNSDIRNSYAVFLCSSGQFARGEKMALEAAVDPLYKTPEAAYLNAGFCARSGNDLKQAEKYFRQALTVRPNFAQALIEMAEVEYQGKNYLPARAFLERYIAAYPMTSRVLWLGVRIEKALGNRGAAGDYARRMKSDFATADETKLLIESERRGG